MSDMNWTNLTSIEQLGEIDQISNTTPVVIFKHSTRCSISAASLSRMERKWDNAKSGGLKPFYLDLIAHRDISNEIASRYGIEHQSPQVLLIHQGKCVYDTSHFGISFEDLIDNMSAVSQ